MEHVLERIEMALGAMPGLLTVARVGERGPVAPSFPPAAITSMPMEVADQGWDICFSTDIRIEGGDIVIGEAPGLGITVDERKLAELEVEQPSRPSGLPWGRRQGAGLYVVPLTEE